MLFLKRAAFFGRGIQLYTNTKPDLSIKTDGKYGICMWRKVLKTQNVLSSCVFTKSGWFLVLWNEIF